MATIGYNKDIPVVRRDLRHKYLARYKSISVASKKTGCPESAISACINGKQKSAHNSLWEIGEGIDGRLKEE